MRQQMMARQMKLLNRRSLGDLLRPVHIIALLTTMQRIHEDRRFLRRLPTKHAVPLTPPQKPALRSQPVLSRETLRPRHRGLVSGDILMLSEESLGPVIDFCAQGPACGRQEVEGVLAFEEVCVVPVIFEGDVGFVRWEEV